MATTETDFAKLADAVQEMRETVNAVVMGLVADGVDEEQARAIATGIFANMVQRNKARGDE